MEDNINKECLWILVEKMFAVFFTLLNGDLFNSKSLNVSFVKNIFFYSSLT